MKKHIVLISPHFAMIDCALFNGLDVTVIDQNKNAKSSEYMYGVRYFHYDYHDIAISKEVIKAINDVYPIDAILTLTETALQLAALLSEVVNIKTLTPRTMRLVHDKGAMRNFLADKNGFSIGYSLPKSSKDLADFADINGYPLIIKPVGGYGSQGVVKIGSSDELKNFQFSPNVIVEQFLEGDEYSVECFSFDGEHAVIAITRKMLMPCADGGNFTEMGHCVPASLTPENSDQICGYIKRFLTLIGIDNGPSHTEIKVSGSKINLIETHNRIGGDRISSLVKISTGVDLVELSILWPIGLCLPIQGAPTTKCHAAIRFFNPPCGELLAVTGVEVVKCCPGIIAVELNCKPGDSLLPIKNSFGRYGFVIATGNNETDAVANSIGAVEKVLFNVSE